MKTNADPTKDNPLSVGTSGDPQFKTQYISLDKAEATIIRAVTKNIEAKRGIFTSQCSIREEETEEEQGAAAALRGRWSHCSVSARRHSAGPEDTVTRRQLTDSWETGYRQLKNKLQSYESDKKQMMCSDKISDFTSWYFVKHSFAQRLYAVQNPSVWYFLFFFFLTSFLNLISLFSYKVAILQQRTLHDKIWKFNLFLFFCNKEIKLIIWLRVSVGSHAPKGNPDRIVSLKALQALLIYFAWLLIIGRSWWSYDWSLLMSPNCSCPTIREATKLGQPRRH